MRCLRWFAVAVTASGLMIGIALAQQPAAATVNPRLAEIERFLRGAKMGQRKAISVGVAETHSVLMDDGKLKHRGHIATIDVSKTSFTTDRGTELNFRDSWKFNVAAYELAKLLDFNMVPPSVERSVSGQSAAVTWWIDDAMMESERQQKKLHAPDPDRWSDQMYAVRVFDQLIYNVDANLTNLLITKDWNIWMIDHTRSFRWAKTLESPKNLLKCDRTLLAKMRELNKPLLKDRLGRWLLDPEIDGVLARRDKIVHFFDTEIAAKGESAVLFDLPPRQY